MFFPAFESPRMSPEFIFTLEHYVAHILVGCDRSFLAHACETGTLVTSMADELDFLGFYKKELQGESVREYLAAHDEELMAFAKKILADPDNSSFLDQSLLPHRLPTTFARRA